MMTRSKGVRKAAPRRSATTITEGRPVEAGLDNTQSGEAPASTEEGGAEATAAPLPTQQETGKACVTPLEYMLSVMRDPAVEPARRDEMAKLALPYLHPKPTALGHTGRSGGPIDTTDLSETDIARRVGFLMAWGALLRESSER